MSIFTTTSMKRHPITYVTPSKIGWKYENLISLFHNSIIDENAFAGRKLFVDNFLFFCYKIIQYESFKHLRNNRLENSKSIYFGIHIPYKNTGIPTE